MSGFTIRNLKTEVEDLAPRYGQSPDIEARFARGALGSEKAAVSYLRLAPDFRMPFGHRHREREEIYVVVAGGVRVRLEDEVREMARWDALRVGPEVRRSFEAGPEGVELIVFGAPRTEPNDAEPLPGWWGDDVP